MIRIKISDSSQTDWWISGCWECWTHTVYWPWKIEDCKW